MRPLDLMHLALSTLHQQKVRTLLSLVGVTVGTFALALSLSVGRGVESAFVRQLRENDQLRTVYVSSSFEADSADVPAETLDVKGIMTPARRRRLRQAIISRWNREHFARPEALLTEMQMRDLRRIRHVRAIIPASRETGRAALDGRRQLAVMASADTGEAGLRQRIVAGQLYTSPSERSAVVHEHLVYAWGITDEADVGSVVGRTIQLSFASGRRSQYPVLSMLTGGKVKPDAPEHHVLERLVPRLWPLLGRGSLDHDERAVARLILQGLTPPDDPYQDPPITEALTIVGVVRGTTKDDPSGGVAATWVSRDADVLLPYATAEEYFFRAPGNAERGADAATLLVDSEEHVQAVAEEVRRRGFYEYSLVKVIDTFRQNVLLVTLALASSPR